MHSFQGCTLRAVNDAFCCVRSPPLFASGICVTTHLEIHALIEDLSEHSVWEPQHNDSL